MCQTGGRRNADRAEIEMQIPKPLSWDEGMEQILRATFAGDVQAVALRIDMKSIELLVLECTRGWTEMQGPPSCIGLPLAEVLSAEAFGHVKSRLQESFDDFVDKWVDLVARKTYELGAFYFCSPEGDEFSAMVAVTLSASKQRLGSGEIELYLEDIEFIGNSDVSKLALVELWTKRNALVSL